MKTTVKIITTTILAAASLGAWAQSTVPTEAARDAANMHALNQYPVVSFQATKTRAEVKAELVAAEHAGTIVNTDAYPVLQQAQSHKTREEVQQELVQAEREGTIANGDDYPIIRQAPSHKSRAEVKAELAAANGSASAASSWRGQ